MTVCGRSFLLVAIFSSLLTAGDPPLINVKELAPGIVVDMRYAGPNNFTKQTLYDASVCLLNESAARRLARVQARLEKEGLGLKVWDCYRPLSVQKKLWEIVPNPEYVADPKTGSRHNRGASVDLTLVDAAGKELEMPTGFDDFSEKAGRNYWKLSKPALRNRQKLENAMKSEGFIGLPSEWWHFDDPQWQSYALRDEPLSSPALLVDQMTAAATAQLVLVLTDDWDAVTGTLTRFDKAKEGWAQAGGSVSISVGLKGMAWGKGLHPEQSAGPQKKEGDLRATAGIFKIGQAYGYESQAPQGSRWPYQQVDETWRCIDDPASASYNQVKRIGLDEKKDWKSAEHMKRNDHLYKWVLNVEQNFPAVTGGCGSCIFLHVWRKPGSGTEGCTSMAEEKMVELLSWLDPSKNPVIAQLPKAEYARFKDSWKLP